MLFYHTQSTNIFDNRRQAGRMLADKLRKYENIYLLALPRGGVEVAYEIAKKLYVPMDVLIVRKIGSPYNPEFAIGAIAENDVTILNQGAIDSFNISLDAINNVIAQEQAEMQRRIKFYRNKRTFTMMEGKTVIIIDDGLATGMTAQAAIQSVKNNFSPKKLVFAAPICAKKSLDVISSSVDAIECLHASSDLQSIGAYYHEFSQTTDEEVMNLLSYFFPSGL